MSHRVDYSATMYEAMMEWSDGPRTMKETADWANKWLPQVRADHERLTATLRDLRAEHAALQSDYADAIRALAEANESLLDPLASDGISRRSPTTWERHVAMNMRPTLAIARARAVTGGEG